MICRRVMKEKGLALQPKKKRKVKILLRKWRAGNYKFYKRIYVSYIIRIFYA